MSDLYQVRPVIDTDHGYVIDTWRDSFRTESEIARWDDDIYRRLMARTVRDILRADGTRAVVACDREDPDTIMAWAVSRGPELHYVYVRGGRDVSFRKMGLVALLLEGETIEAYTFKTAAGVRRMKPDARGWAYRPHESTWCNGKFKVEIAA